MMSARSLNFDCRPFNDLADIIVDNLQSPDLLTLEEVQDNNGAVDNGETGADLTLQQLVDAIAAAGGPSYTWQQIDPRNDQEGGEPGGNIRVAFLIQEGTPLSFVERDPGTSSEDTNVVDGATGPELTHSPGRVDPATPPGRRHGSRWPASSPSAARRSSWSPTTGAARAETSRCSVPSSRPSRFRRPSGSSRPRSSTTSSTRSTPRTPVPTSSCWVTSTTSSTPTA